MIDLSWIENILKDNNPETMEELITRADQVRRKFRGEAVYLRGLIEFTNYCQRNCYYCGLRRDNNAINRYRLSAKEIIDLALQANQMGFQSLALQSGENPDRKTVDFLVRVVSEIRELTTRDSSIGLGITLSVGELSYADYKRLYEAGGHRYLLRIETTDPQLFASIHPPSQTLEKRIECLKALKDIGYQVGTGIMVGLPGQTPDHLLADLQFFVDMDVDMIGMGPYIPHPQTPMGREPSASQVDPWVHTLKVMALTRILMPDINMVASTALQSLRPDGLKWGLRAGANVVMPILTPIKYREDYRLYADKKYKPFPQLKEEIEEAGFRLGLWQWGDSLRWAKRQQQSEDNKVAGHLQAEEAM